jgi:hypothetical protein
MPIPGPVCVPFDTVPHRVLKSLVTHERGACLQISPAHKIKPAGVTQHVRVDVQRREFSR